MREEKGVVQVKSLSNQLALTTGLNKVEAGLSLATDENLELEYFLCTTVKLPVPALLWKATIIFAHSLQQVFLLDTS
jgi:hypothetical protein